MVEEKAALGIQKLLQAEHEAADVVAVAKTEKVDTMKKAKKEAEQEIARYKATREDQFVIFSKERSGDSGSHKTATDALTVKELATINKQVAANKDTMVQMLLQSVTTVG
uniref:V-type proton ATPase subunit G n=1 Tax=Coccolithus braarudii TaxID=221442 RepID=A0A7S0Q7T4_9EUKA